MARYIPYLGVSVGEGLVGRRAEAGRAPGSRAAPPSSPPLAASDTQPSGSSYALQCEQITVNCRANHDHRRQGVREVTYDDDMF